MTRKDTRNTLYTIVHSCVGIVVISIGLGLASVPNAWAAEGPLYPLKPPDTSSPQATMRSYLEAMQAGSESFASLMERYQREPGLSFSPAAHEEYERLSRQLHLARRCFDLQKVSPRLELKVALDSMLLLKEVLDRLDLPALDSVPDARAMEEQNQERWRIPHTEIVIAKVKEGAHAGEYLFSPDTIEHLPEFFKVVRSLPYKPGSWNGVYAFYSSIGQHRFIPWKLTESLPSWTKIQVLEQALWRWIVLGSTLLLIMAILVIISRWSRQTSDNRPLHRYGRRIVMPATISVAAWFLSFLLDAVNITGQTHVIIATALGGTLFLAAAWAIMLFGHVLAEIIFTTPDIRPRSLDEAIGRLAVRVTTFVVAALVVLYGAEWLGLPVVPLIAGLGVGSLALALAAQPTIENFIAGLTLYADRQVRVGDFCRFGETLGTVEEIGMRSTRIRTLDHTVVSVPNADFSKSRLENYSARKKIWYHPRIRLPYDTSPDQLRYVLIEVRRLLCAHPRVLPEPAYIRFAEFGEHSINLEVFAYINTANYGEFLEIREDLNLRLMDVITSAGTRLAIPAQIEYQADASPLDPERKRQVEARVEEWRSRGALDLPKMPPEKIAELKDSLAYPPAGSSARKEPPNIV
jgi:MscS family membrane protein